MPNPFSATTATGPRDNLTAREPHASHANRTYWSVLQRSNLAVPNWQMGRIERLACPKRPGFRCREWSNRARPLCTRMERFRRWRRLDA